MQLRSVPEISGGMLAEEVHTGRVLAMQGGFDVVGSSYNRAIQALRQPGSAFKPIVYVTALENGFTPATIELDAPFCVWQGAGLGNKCFVNFDHRYAGPHTLRWGLEQSRNLMTVRAASTDRNAEDHRHGAQARRRRLSAIICRSRSAPATRPSLRLVNAYAILANQGRSVKPTTIDYVEDRNGKVIYRTDNRCAVMGNCNAADWDGKAMPRPPSRTRQLVDPMAAFQMVHIMEGVIIRGTATVLRDLNRPLFGKTGTTNGPTNVWFVGGTPDIVAGVYMGYDQPRPMGGYAQGGRICGADLQAMGADRAQGPAQGAVRRAARHSLGADRPRDRQARCSASSRRREDPKSAVIWEAFQPQTEPRRSYRGAIGDPYDQAAAATGSSRNSVAGRSSGAAAAGAAAGAAAAAGRRSPPTGLPTQNAL